jgi:hypothetical protein
MPATQLQEKHEAGSHAADAWMSSYFFAGCSAAATSASNFA